MPDALNAALLETGGTDEFFLAISAGDSLRVGSIQGWRSEWLIGFVGRVARVLHDVDGSDVAASESGLSSSFREEKLFRITRRIDVTCIASRCAHIYTYSSCHEDNWWELNAPLDYRGANTVRIQEPGPALRSTMLYCTLLRHCNTLVR